MKLTHLICWTWRLASIGVHRWIIDRSKHLCHWQFHSLLGYQLCHQFLFLLCLVSLRSYWILQVDQPLELSRAEEGCHCQSLSEKDMVRMTFLCHHQVCWQTLAQEVNDPSVKKRSLISNKTPSIMQCRTQGCIARYILVLEEKLHIP